MYKKFEMCKNKNDENNDPLTDGLDKEDEEKAIIDNTFDRTTPGQGTQKITRKNVIRNELFRPKHIEQHPFPHVNNRAIHLITFKQGDQQTYPQAYSTVHLLYTGYIYAPSNSNSQEPTDREFFFIHIFIIYIHICIYPSTTDTISATPLGIGQNISGIEHAVMRMSVGQRARVYVPSRLAYGSYGAKELIPPNADLIFDLHLIAIHSPLNNDEANVAMLKEPNSESENEHAVENDENDNIINNLSNGVINSYDNVNNQPFAASEKFITQEIHEQNRKPLENLLAEDNSGGHSLLDEPTEDL
ncbi:hypothetical protein RFI_21413 [Reticulomyxa filosa]|uniref:peptidylprolyl isomerase n=1 Tax=Reticulomyxa filosa TaxID=46433 RepID=X6MS94_RETFI|nr:hypothetical protein RFI_21413 [Reticulomyxa filosa]|eukprot:ETO15950.1 hypothetical protein RFI_21413 [Reticulomyxa filosa]